MYLDVDPDLDSILVIEPKIWVKVKREPDISENSVE